VKVRSGFELAVIVVVAVVALRALVCFLTSAFAYLAALFVMGVIWRLMWHYTR